jgi:NAD(P)H-dependent FMN reductase
LRARDAKAEDVLGADGHIFATPENLASMAGIARDLFDRTNHDARDRINGRTYVTPICAGSDGTNAVRQIDRICTGWRLKRIAEPLIVCTRAGAPGAIPTPKTITPEDLERCREIGSRSGRRSRARHLSRPLSA